MRGVGTRSIYAAREGNAFTEPVDIPDRFARAEELAQWLSRVTRNDLEEPACTLLPQIREVRTALSGLPGSMHAGMSGSGATCFALFAGRETATQGARTLRKARPGWWVEAVSLS